MMGVTLTAENNLSFLLVLSGFLGIGLMIYWDWIIDFLKNLFGIPALKIIFGPKNPSKRFWSMVKGPYWEYRVAIKNTSMKTIRNLRVEIEHLGQMSQLPTEGIFINGQPLYDIQPHTEKLAVVLRWPIPIKQPGMISDNCALAYGPIKVTVSSDDTKPVVRIFDFDYQREPMLFNSRSN